MATTNKDFVVKNGLVVNNGATFGDSIVIGPPTLNSHATTKSYVDDAISSLANITVSSTEPHNSSDGDIWLDSNIEKLKVYYSGSWIVMSTYEDSLSVTQHTHDEITGFVSDTFTESPAINETPVLYIDGGSAGTTTFDTVLDGGNV